MAVKPILFSTPMVQAILDGRKTMTRRIVKPRYRDDESGFQVITRTSDGACVRVEKIDLNESGIFADGSERYVNEPYQPGDILYVRETWNINKSGSIEEWNYRYKADGDENWWLSAWRPSIHMPKAAARIWLRVNAVKAEHLQQISQDDMMLEGCWPGCADCIEHGGCYLPDVCGYVRDAWVKLWDGQYADSDFSWNSNPWVWVISFEQIEKPEVK